MNDRDDMTYNPTPAEIERECRRIRATWSPATEQSRRVTSKAHAELRHVVLSPIDRQLVTAMPEVFETHF